MNHRNLALLRLWTCVALVACAPLGANVFAGESDVPEFRIGKGGRRILLPLTLGDREILAVLDTGSSSSAFDRRLEPVLGEYRGSRKVQSPAGLNDADIFAWPDVRLGELKIKTDRPVVSLDLEGTRRASGKDIFAIVGMDVLKLHRLQFDFDAGVLRILRSLPAKRDELGEALPIVFAADGTPGLAGCLGDGREERFLIDTGAEGNSLEADLFDELLQQGRISVGGPSMSVTVNGPVSGEAGKLDLLTMGSFAHPSLRFARINLSSVGMRYLSRFRVTLDFPGKTAYVRKGAAFSRPEPAATSGLALSWVDGEVVVQAVLQHGPGDSAGIRPADVITRVNGADADEYDHHSLRKLLTSEVGKKIPLAIRRATRTIEVVIVLGEK